MADPELGTKQVCPNCEAKFYDLNRRPATCPKCGHSFDPADEIVQATKTKIRTKAAQEAVPEDEEEDPEEVEATTAAPVDEDEEESGEEQAKELGGDEDEVALDMSGDSDDSEDAAPGKVPTGFSEEGVDDDDDEVLLDDEEDDFELGDDDIDVDDDNELGEPDAEDIDPNAN
ncbi:MAG: TIGR02300 family protein [Pseudomonadota bacterium]